jgi:hypothetical protein
MKKPVKKSVECSICGKEVQKSDRWPNGELDMINGAVIGEYLAIKGHKECLENLDRIVIGVNRMRVYSFIDSLKQRFEEEKLMNDELDNLLEHAKVIEIIEPGAIPKA